MTAADGLTTQTYTVALKRAVSSGGATSAASGRDVALSSVAVAETISYNMLNGTWNEAGSVTLSPTFMPDVTTYTASVDHSITRLDVGIAKKYIWGTTEIDVTGTSTAGGPLKVRRGSYAAGLSWGKKPAITLGIFTLSGLTTGKNTISIKLTDGALTRTYTVTLMRNSQVTDKDGE